MVRMVSPAVLWSARLHLLNLRMVFLNCLMEETKFCAYIWKTPREQCLVLSPSLEDQKNEICELKYLLKVSYYTFGYP